MLEASNNTVSGTVAEVISIARDEHTLSMTKHDQTQHPDAAVVVAGDFNRSDLKKVLPNVHHHITCATRGEITLDHCYTPFKRGYRAASLPPFGKSDHAAIYRRINGGKWRAGV